MGLTQIHFVSAVRQQRAGNLTEAEALYHQILLANPRHADAIHLLGVLDYQRGQHDQAIDGIARAIAIDPVKPAYRNNLGVALRAAGRLTEAIDAYHEALRLSPDYADAHANLAVALHESRKPGQAVRHFEAALRLKPDHPDALYNLANLCHEQGRSVEAVPLYRRAHQVAPGRADILNNLGNALLAVEQTDEAIAAYRRAAEVDPVNADAHANLGAALVAQERLAEAADAFGHAARLRPAEAHWPLRIAALCPVLFPSVAAIERYRVGLEAVLDAHRGGIRLPADPATSGCHPPSFQLAHHGRPNRALREKFADHCRANFPDLRPPAGTGPARIGFVANHPHEGGFLRGHAGIVQRLDPARFRPVVFGTERAMPALRTAIRRPDAELIPLPDRLPAAAARIAEARCAVLYHWQIGTDAWNYFLPFYRPAPIQCTSWGTHGTSGIAEVDYYLSGDLIEAPDADDHYTESLVRLASLPTFQARPPRPDPPATRAEFGLPEGSHLYACLQRPHKFHPDFDALLADILRRDPAGLVVLRQNRPVPSFDPLRDRLRATIPDVADRVIVLPAPGLANYYRLLSLADAVLDPLHFGSGLTALDAFGLDLPMVTLPGPFGVDRFSLACYRKMGVTDLVAADAAGYINRAVRLGTDRDYRAEVVGRIAAASPALFEDDSTVREHERFFARAAGLNGSGPGGGCAC